MPAVRQVLAHKITQWEANGTAGRPIRMMIVGIPNVGKSSLINRLAGARRTKVEDRPGVTRGKQWVTLPDGVELLDMPGVLWPKFEDQRVGENLAFVGSVRDQILDVEELAMRLLQVLTECGYLPMVVSRYRLEDQEAAQMDAYDLLEYIGKKRGMLMAGGRINTERTAVMLLDEFRGGQIGRITLEQPD